MHTTTHMALRLRAWLGIAVFAVVAGCRSPQADTYILEQLRQMADELNAARQRGASGEPTQRSVRPDTGEKGLARGDPSRSALVASETACVREADRRELRRPEVVHTQRIDPARANRVGEPVEILPPIEIAVDEYALGVRPGCRIEVR